MTFGNFGNYEFFPAHGTREIKVAPVDVVPLRIEAYETFIRAARTARCGSDGTQQRVGGAMTFRAGVGQEGAIRPAHNVSLTMLVGPNLDTWRLTAGTSSMGHGLNSYGKTQQLYRVDVRQGEVTDARMVTKSVEEVPLAVEIDGSTIREGGVLRPTVREQYMTPESCVRLGEILRFSAARLQQRLPDPRIGTGVYLPE